MTYESFISQLVVKTTNLKEFLKSFAIILQLINYAISYDHSFLTRIAYEQTRSHLF